MSVRMDRSGFTLLEVMIATIILSIGLVVLLTSFSNCQKVMKASQDHETAQYVLSLGETVYPIPSPEEEGNEEPAADGAAQQEQEKRGLLHTERILDLEELAKEDKERTFEGILFRVELVDENGQALDATTATQLRSEADALLTKRRPAGAAWSNTSGEIDLGASGDDAEKPEVRPENEGRVIYETNGNCAPYRVTLFAATEENEEGEELMTVNVSRSGKVTIGDEEDSKRR